jgi:hypothetical protein
MEDKATDMIASLSEPVMASSRNVSVDAALTQHPIELLQKCNEIAASEFA